MSTEPVTAPVRCEVAAFLVESSEIVGARPDAVLRAIRDRWPAADDEEIERAEDIALFLAGARRAAPQSDAEYLIEKTRLLFGALAAASLAHRYGLAAASP